MNESKRKIFRFAVTSRVAVFVLQFIFNAICPDHNADAFKNPFDPNVTSSYYDDFINFLFSGLTRWDGEYILHIAKYGYTFENLLAFYPLYPMTVRTVALILKNVFFMLNMNSLVTLAAVILNFVCFIKSALVFFDLSNRILLNVDTAYIATLLYCINPASIFFSAAYTESMFAYFTFSSMLKSLENNPLTSVPVALSALVRSNGLINIGFPIYFWLKQQCDHLFIEYNNQREGNIFKTFLKFVNVITLKQAYLLLSTIIISVSPFILLQIYNYVTFCTPGVGEMFIPNHLLEYGAQNNLVLPHSGNTIWCKFKIPIAYSYIQKQYWNVGLMNYYELKQIPNFILALPILCIMMMCIIEFCVENKHNLYSLGLVPDFKRKTASTNIYSNKMMVFIIHGLFLTLFCIFFVHIQVSTRLLCSASPLVYWYCALSICRDRVYYANSKTRNNAKQLLPHKWIVSVLLQEYTLKNKALLSYFLVYIIVGCFMFSNFLPWT